MLTVFFEREDVDRRQFCRCIIGVSGVPRGPYCVCKTKMATCALRIKCCVLESYCSFDGSFPSRSTDASCCLWIIHLHVQMIESFFEGLKQVKIQWDTIHCPPLGLL